MNKLLRKFGALLVTVAMMTMQSLPVMADDNRVNRYIIGTADDEFGMFPFPPWDVIDPVTGENVGLDGQFIRAIDAANKRMEVKLQGVHYSDCGTGDPFVLGNMLARGALDGCSSWAQTSRRRQAGASFAVAVQSVRFAPKAVLVRSAVAPSLTDADNALDAIVDGEIGIVSGFAADLLCLQGQYSESSDLGDKVTIDTEENIFDRLWSAELSYAWVLVTETNFPPPGTVLAHDMDAVKNSGTICGGPYALMLNEESSTRRHKSALLRLDANCGAALIAARSELEADQDFTIPQVTNKSVSNTDFQDIACGQLVPTADGSEKDFSGLCALDEEIALPTLQCLEANDL